MSSISPVDNDGSEVAAVATAACDSCRFLSLLLCLLVSLQPPLQLTLADLLVRPVASEGGIAPLPPKLKLCPLP